MHSSHTLRRLSTNSSTGGSTNDASVSMSAPRQAVLSAHYSAPALLGLTRITLRRCNGHTMGKRAFRQPVAEPSICASLHCGGMSVPAHCPDCKAELRETLLGFYAVHPNGARSRESIDTSRCPLCGVALPGHRHPVRVKGER